MSAVIVSPLVETFVIEMFVEVPFFSLEAGVVESVKLELFPLK